MQSNEANKSVGYSARKQEIYSKYAKGIIDREQLVSELEEINLEIIGPSSWEKIKRFLARLVDQILPPGPFK